MTRYCGSLSDMPYFYEGDKIKKEKKEYNMLTVKKMKYYVQASVPFRDSIGEDYYYEHYEGMVCLESPVNSVSKMKEDIKAALYIQVNKPDNIIINMMVPVP